jgi:acyl transferase domain-containing protein
MLITDSDPSVRPEGDRKALLLKAVQAIDSLQSRLDAMERDRTEPIAIVGLSCRFPGSKDPEAFWRVLSEGIDTVKEVPNDRWDRDALDGPDPSAPGNGASFYGGFLDHVDLFEPAFFGISGREAESMDPQQRLLLEVAWEALENAGIAVTQLRGSSTGVFVGVTSSDYGRLSVANNSTELDVYAMTGGALNVAAGRLSYVFGLNGPAMAVDTACSSSLVAVHLACRSLRDRECDMALAGGVNLILAPEPFICFSKWGMLAPDGRCKTFDERADGFVRGEGCGVIALKRLSDALKAEDRVLAVIRGSAVNQDGASSGLTVPNGLAQQALVRAALKAARLQPYEVDYVEAHGTGTTLGDPIELEALAAALGKNRPSDRPLRVGSVKSNHGHLESASGIAGLIKVVLSMGREEIPRQLHFHKLNPRISLGTTPIEIPVNAMAWPRSEHPRIAGVSSFGFSGTNAHVILEEAPTANTLATTGQSPERSTHLLVLSASSDAALRELSLGYAEHVAKAPAGSLPDICHTAATGRSALSYRLAVLSTSNSATRDRLGAFAERNLHPEIVSGRTRSDSRVAFLFTGQGAQHMGMGRDLYEIEPVFRHAFDQCALSTAEHLDRPLQEIVGYDTKSPAREGILDETRYTQPALFAVEYALASLWRSWGIEPAAIVGHSLGEYVGACVAGALSLEDALRLVTLRSRLMHSLPRNGAMAAVFAGEGRVRLAIASFQGSVSIAAINSPLNTVISGKADDVGTVLERLRQEGVESKPLSVSHAFHSPLVEPILDEFEECAQGVDYRVPDVDLILNLTGCPLGETLPLDSNYWRRHARETVKFAESVRCLHGRGIRAFLEIGPAPVLIGMARQSVEDSESAWLASLRKDRDAWPQMLSSLGALFVLGAKPDWSAFDRPFRRRRVALPTYPFQRERHWLPIPPAGSTPPQTQRTVHPLLGIHVPLAGHPGEHVWFGRISLELLPWINDHRVEGAAVVPATAYVEMALAAVVEAGSELPVVLTGIEIEKVLLLEPTIEFEIQTRLEREEESMRVFQVHSRRKDTKGAWTLHARGTLRTGGTRALLTTFDASERDDFKKHSTRCLDGVEFYRLHKERGNQWGPSLQGVIRVWQGLGEALSEVTFPAGIETDISHYLFHPALSDATGHVLTATIPLEKSDARRGGAFVGAGIGEVRVHRRPEGKHFYAYAQLRSTEAGPDNTLLGDVKVFDVAGNLITETIGARLWYLDSAQKQDVLEPVEDWLYEPRWLVKDTRDLLSAETPLTEKWIIFRDQQGIGDALCAQLRERGATCLCVDHGEQRSQAKDSLMTVRPEYAEDYDDLLRTAFPHGSVIDRIVHLWSLDAVNPEQADLRAVQAAQTLGSVSVLRIVQALDRARLPVSPKLWLITRGAQPAGEKAVPLSLLQSPLWGLGRTIAMEHSDFWGGQLDLAPAHTTADAGTLMLRQLVEPDGEDQIAIRDGHRHVLRLARRAKTMTKPLRIPIHQDATYLITGGLGGIGLIIARWLAVRGARHVILAGRNALATRLEWDGISSETIEDARMKAIREIESFGANVQMMAVDMGNESSVTEIISQCLRTDRPPLRGVFHAAGVMQYEPLLSQTPEQMRDILAAKMLGGWFLHRLLARVPLDLFVLFSSSSTLLSSPLMGSYSAANVFLDALAHHRRATGRAALSVNWGTWAEAGMATQFQAREKSKRHGRTGATKGVGLLPTGRALEALERLLEDGAVQAGVMPIDWNLWQRSYGSLAGAPYLSLLISGSDFSASSRSDTAGDGESREKIVAARPENRREMVRAYLAKQMARILKISLSSVEHEMPISNMGFDSLMSIELKNQLESDLAVSASMAQLLRGPTLSELVELVSDLLEVVQPAEVALAATSSANDFEEGVL